MIDFKKQPVSSDDKDMLRSLESIAFECSLHVSPTARHDYDMKVSDWINSFTGDLAFRRQRYLSHYLRKKYEYMNDKSSI